MKRDLERGMGLGEEGENGFGTLMKGNKTNPWNQGRPRHCGFCLPSLKSSTPSRTLTFLWLPWWLSGRETACQGRRCGECIP